MYVRQGGEVLLLCCLFVSVSLLPHVCESHFLELPQNLEEILVNSTSHIFEILETAVANRHVAATKCNERSRCVYVLVLCALVCVYVKVPSPLLLMF